MASTSPDKMHFIHAYFDDLERRIDLLPSLDAAGYREEALILALVYIDGLAQQLSWPNKQQGRNYVLALTTYSADQQFGLVHPKQLCEALDRLSPSWQTISSAIRSAYPGPAFELVPPSEILDEVREQLSAGHFADLERDIWRGTIAAVAYYWMRNPAIHALGASDITFADTTYLGDPVQALDLPRLTKAAKHLTAEARRRSEATGDWFGHSLAAT